MNTSRSIWGKNIYNVTTLAGDNGSGKTTILNCVIGLMLSDYRNDVERTHLKGSEGENWLGIFFAYEQYKQVKYVFDKKQYAILRRLKERGYHVPVPRKVTVTMESADARMVRSAEKGAAQLRTVLAKKAALFPGAVKRMKIWEEQIRDGAEIDEPSFFTDAVLYGLGCNCVLSFLRSCILNLEEAGRGSAMWIL